MHHGRSSDLIQSVSGQTGLGIGANDSVASLALVKAKINTNYFEVAFLLQPTEFNHIQGINKEYYT